MKRMKRRLRSLEPDEIFLDSRNLPSFDLQQFEGQMERPIPRAAFYVLGLVFLFAGLIFSFRVGYLQLVQGEAFAARAENNRLRHRPVFAERGIISDRFGVELAWNDPGRRYTTEPGFGHLLGYISYPNEEELASGRYYPEEWLGREGVEKFYNRRLHGQSGVKIEELDARGENQSDYLLEPPREGQPLTLSIDSRLQTELFKILERFVKEGLYQGASAVLLDARTGEVIVFVSVPEFDPNVLAGGEEAKIAEYVNDPRHPFLNRAAAGLYPPGSVIKPFVAAAALTEGVVTPETKILSTGELVVPNPFYPDQPSVFKDWKAHGLIDLRQAIAFSSNVYFYTIGGGFGERQGLGIGRIKLYADRFGLGRLTGLDLPAEAQGLVPTPEWKAALFDGEPWRLGDTYHTVIGQYGFQVTPIQIARAIAAIGNGGYLTRPTMLALEAGEAPPLEKVEGVSQEALRVVAEGMRLAVTAGTARGLDVPYVAAAAKTGTAEVGPAKSGINSMIAGFFPYPSARYAFAAVLEGAKAGTLIGGVATMRQFLDRVRLVAPEYFD